MPMTAPFHFTHFRSFGALARDAASKRSTERRLRLLVLVASVGLAQNAEAQMGPPPGTQVGAQLPIQSNILTGQAVLPPSAVSGMQMAPAANPLAGRQAGAVQSPYVAANPAAPLRLQPSGPSVIPPPPMREFPDPKRGAGQPARMTQAKQQFVNPERAYDPETGESFFWDCTKKSWINSKTHQAVGFQGGKATDGEVIPPPPKLELADSERMTEEGLVARITQAKQDTDNPARAFDPDSKQVLVWDPRQNTWIDTKTGEAIGFIGRKGVTACQPSVAAGLPPSQVALAHAPVLDDLMFKERVAVAPSDSFFLAAGAGQALLQMELLLTSKQSVIGGGLRLTPPPPPPAEAKTAPEVPTFLQLSRAMAANPL